MTHQPRPTLRQKLRVDPKATDLQLFNALTLGDTWCDAHLIPVYAYLRKGVVVPSSWESTMNKFDADLLAAGFTL